MDLDLLSNCTDAGTASNMYAPDADHNFFIHSTTPPRRFQVYAEPLTRPRQKWGNAMPAKAHDTEASEGRLAKKQKAAQEEQTQQPTESAKNDVSSTLVDPVTQPDKKRAACGLVQPVEHSTDQLNPPDVEQATEAGWCEKDMGRGGDCFFRAYVKAENLFSTKSRANNRWPRQPCNSGWTQYSIDDMEKQYKRAGQPAPKSFDGFLKPRKAITPMSTSSRRLPPALEHRWLSGERIARKWVMSKTKETIRQKISSVQICGTGVFGHPVSSKTRLAVIRNVLAFLLCCHLTITHVLCLLSIRNLRCLHG